MAKIPVTLESGTADGILAKASSIFVDSENAFLSVVLDTLRGLINNTSSEGIIEESERAQAAEQENANNILALTKKVEALVSFSGTNFLGIKGSVPTETPTTTAAWCLVGATLSSLKLYVYYNGTWSKFNDTVYDFAGNIGLNIIEVTNEGFYIVDNDLNVGFSVKADGIHAKNLLTYEIID